MRSKITPEKRFLFAAILCTASAVYAQAATSPSLQEMERARRLLREVPLIDGHNDLPSALLGAVDGDLAKTTLESGDARFMTDLPRLKQGQVGAQFWAAFVPATMTAPGEGYRHGMREVALIKEMIQRYPQALEFATSAQDIERIHRRGKVASLIGLEGGHAIEDSLDKLRELYAAGVRYMTLTHAQSTSWADSSTDVALHHGLNAFGRAVVREMNQLGMLVDLSHVSNDAARDAMAVSRAPVIFSHSSAAAINSHPRNVPDSNLRLLARNGGVVMVNFYVGFINPEAVRYTQKREQAFKGGLSREDANEWLKSHPTPQADAAMVADHIDHLVAVAGIDHVGIGSDFDGVPLTPVDLKDVGEFPRLIAELLRRGYSDQDVKKIAGLNFLRVMRESEKMAVELRKTAQREIPTTRWSDYQRAFDAYLATTGTVGGSTLLVKGGEIVSRYHAGMADLQLQQPVDDRTLFHFASITKTITAITVMQLRDRGQLSLEDSVTQYLPELRKVNDPFGSPDRITIRMLLNHSSGLQGPTWPWRTGEKWEPFEPTTYQQLEAMLPYQQLAFEPGSQCSYSNPAFIYLARIVEQITGESWISYVQKNVFAPLGMTRSYFSRTPYHLAADRANNYIIQQDADGKTRTAAMGRDFDPGITNGNGGWNAPLEDAAKYLAFLTRAPGGDTATEHLYETVLKRSTLEEMWLPQLPMSFDPANEAHSGLTFFILPRKNATIVGHTGGQSGFLSYLFFNPATRAGVIASFNTKNQTQDRAAFLQLRDLALGLLQ